MDETETKLRDKIACDVMMSLLETAFRNNKRSINEREVAKLSYDMADSMIAERRTRDEPA